MNEHERKPAEKPAGDIESASSASLIDALPELYGLDDKAEKRTLRWTMGVAVMVHILLLVLNMPSFAGPEPLPEPKLGKTFLVETVRFRPPPPKQVQKKKIPKPKAKKIPIPDPTPHDPEPLETVEIDVPDIDTPELEDVIFGIPDAPPGPAGPMIGGPDGPLQVGGDVRPPVKVISPQPKYSEEARKARLQGAVILQTVIDKLGNVRDVKVLKGLTLGLTESAIETVKEWKFKPATRDGVPVAVYFNLVITFSVQ